MKSLPLYPGAKPCVGSGMCCKKAPCQFGQMIGPNNPACMHLKVVDTNNGKHPRYTCGIYEQIINVPGWENSPAFGAGCCSPLFNEDREAIIRDIRNSDNFDDAIRKHHSHDD
jgi:hypothetical protein